MAYAIVMQVELIGDQDAGMKLLDEVVVPLAKAQPGFQRGMWMHNAEMKGTGVMVFDTEEHATAAIGPLEPPPGGPTIISRGVFEVAREV